MNYVLACLPKKFIYIVRFNSVHSTICSHLQILNLIYGFCCCVCCHFFCLQDTITVLHRIWFSGHCFLFSIWTTFVNSTVYIYFIVSTSTHANSSIFLLLWLWWWCFLSSCLAKLHSLIHLDLQNVWKQRTEFNIPYTAYSFSLHQNQSIWFAFQWIFFHRQIFYITNSKVGLTDVTQLSTEVVLFLRCKISNEKIFIVNLNGSTEVSTSKLYLQSTLVSVLFVALSLWIKNVNW